MEAQKFSTKCIKRANSKSCSSPELLSIPNYQLKETGSDIKNINIVVLSENARVLAHRRSDFVLPRSWSLLEFQFQLLLAAKGESLLLVLLICDFIGSWPRLDACLQFQFFLRAKPYIKELITVLKKPVV